MRGLSKPRCGLSPNLRRSICWQWILAAAGVFGIHTVAPTTALGQLRSGRATRSLYQDDLAAQHRGRVRADTGVSPAAFEELEYAQDLEYDSSIPAQPAPLSYSAEPMVSGSYVDESGCNCEQCGGGPVGGCDGTSCDGLGCATCCGDYTLLAPTAFDACPPGCGPVMQLWCRLRIRAEVPIYWRRAQAAPPLVTTAPVGTPTETAGQLGDPATSILFGNGVLSEDPSAGFRLHLSTWLGCDQQHELSFRVWTAGDQNESYFFDSNRIPILTRPFLDTSVSPAQQDTQLVAYPDLSIGNIRIDTASAVNGLELTLKRLLYEDRFTRIDGLYGYQHVKIDEGLGIYTNTTVTNNAAPLQGARLSVADQFETQNDFHGFTYGLMSSRCVAMWKLESMFRLGMGNLRRRAMASGSTTTISGGTTTTEDEGLLARRTNSRQLMDDTFVVVPELGLNLAYTIRPGFDLNLGYNYMLVPKVARAGKLINDNLAVNLSDPLVGALDPSLQLNEEKFWLHSLGFGCQLHY